MSETRVHKVRPEFNGRDHVLTTRDQGSISAALGERERPEFNVRDHSLMKDTRIQLGRPQFNEISQASMRET